MNTFFLLGCLLTQIVAVHGMDQASLAVVTYKEVKDLATSEAMRLRLQAAGFRLTTENEELMDSQINPSNFNLDDVVKNQVVLLIAQQRKVLAQEKGIEIQEDSLKQLITANVLAAWNTGKK